MQIDPELLEKIQKENEEFKKLYEEHTQLKQKVEELNKMKFLTVEQEMEKKQHQKQKTQNQRPAGADPPRLPFHPALKRVTAPNVRRSFPATGSRVRIERFSPSA